MTPAAYGLYGVPLTIYLLWGWLARRLPDLELLSHDAGHLWPALLGWRGDPHLNPIHLLSGLSIGGGFVLLARAWHVLHEAHQQRRLATTMFPVLAGCMIDPFTGKAALAAKKAGAREASSS